MTAVRFIGSYRMLRWMARVSPRKPDAFLWGGWAARNLTIDDAEQWCDICAFPLAVAFFPKPPCPWWWMRFRRWLDKIAERKG